MQLKSPKGRPLAMPGDRGGSYGNREPDQQQDGIKPVREAECSSGEQKGRAGCEASNDTECAGTLDGPARGCVGVRQFENVLAVEAR